MTYLEGKHVVCVGLSKDKDGAFVSKGQKGSDQFAHPPEECHACICLDDQ